ncbi:unnamed protein product [Rangifer tarandus platyrhynchus]|uniref:Uncharacterized protein n=1 Tax=Rangifer tarandus platyrhynchus TaxID=3082113 RepID=A0ABN8ZRI6_RANTA|nr:unnamed protein product [Rangifer tarandus platyrhynchus]
MVWRLPHMGLTTGHSISSPLPTPGKFRGSNPGSAFPATRLIQDPPSHLIITWEFTRVSGSLSGAGAGGSVKTNMHVFCHRTPGLGGSTRMKGICSCVWESPVL